MRTMKLFLAILLSVAIASCGGGGGGGDTGGGGTTTYTLTVTKSGTGSGTVTSSAAGISCGATCSGAYNSGASVTLTATAASGSTFAGWSGGGCTGTGTCTVAMIAATGVTATFNTGSAASTASYNFYSDKNGGLYAVDSSSPTSPQTVDTGVATNSTGTIVYGSYDPATKVASGLHAHYVVYAKGGNIYRVNAVKGQSLAPAQVSSETGAVTVCFTSPDVDLMNVDNSIYIYILPGTDGACNTSDDVEKMVTVGMSASTSPITITPKTLNRIGYGIHDANMSIVGFLVTDSGVLKKCNLNLSTCSDLKTGVSSVSEMGSYWAPFKIYLKIDNGLYVYDAGANTLSSSLYTFTGTTSSWGSKIDSSAFYFADGTKILKLPHNSSSVTTLITETAAINNSQLKLTDNSLVYEVSSKTLKAVPKTGGAATTLASVSGASDSISTLGVPGNYIYYNKTVSGISSAGRILDDATGGSEVSNAAWFGISMPSTISLSLGNAGWSIGKLLRVDGCTSTGCGGGTLKSFDPSTYSGEITLGQFPTDIRPYVIVTLGSGSNLIVKGYNSTNTLSDIFYLNVDTANSLVRITNTTVGEDVVY